VLTGGFPRIFSSTFVIPARAGFAFVFRPGERFRSLPFATSVADDGAFPWGSSKLKPTAKGKSYANEQTQIVSRPGNPRVAMLHRLCGQIRPAGRLGHA